MTSVTSSAFRLRPAPAYDPPYDDERHPEAWQAPVQHHLELLPPPAPAPGRPEPAARPQPPSTGTAPSPARAVAARFVQTCLEIVNGLRPIGHARALARPLEAATVLAAMTYGTRRIQQATRRSGGRATLRRMRVCAPRPGALEIAAVIGAGDRAWAAAFRLEQRNGRWQCTAAAIL